MCDSWSPVILVTPNSSGLLPLTFPLTRSGTVLYCPMDGRPITTSTWGLLFAVSGLVWVLRICWPISGCEVAVDTTLELNDAPGMETLGASPMRLRK